MVFNTISPYHRDASRPYHSVVERWNNNAIESPDDIEDSQCP